MFTKQPQSGIAPTNPQAASQVVVTKSSTPPPLPGTPHYQGHGAENRLSMLSVDYSYGAKNARAVVSPNMTDMKNTANNILRTNNKPMTTAVFAPNEAASLVHTLQNILGI